MKYLLKNGTVVSGSSSEQLDVLTEDEKIIKVARDLLMVIHILTWKWQALLLQMILRQVPELPS